MSEQDQAGEHRRGAGQRGGDRRRESPDEQVLGRVDVSDEPGEQVSGPEGRESGGSRGSPACARSPPCALARTRNATSCEASRSAYRNVPRPMDKPRTATTATDKAAMSGCCDALASRNPGDRQQRDAAARGQRPGRRREQKPAPHRPRQQQEAKQRTASGVTPVAGTGGHAGTSRASRGSVTEPRVTRSTLTACSPGSPAPGWQSPGLSPGRAWVVHPWRILVMGGPPMRAAASALAPGGGQSRAEQVGVAVGDDDDRAAGGEGCRSSRRPRPRWPGPGARSARRAAAAARPAGTAWPARSSAAGRPTAAARARRAPCRTRAAGRR